MSKSIFVITLAFVTTSAISGVLGKGKKLVRLGTTSSTATSIWVGDEETDFANDGERVQKTYDLSFAYGLGDGWQIDFRTGLAEAEMTKGNMADASEGDKEDGITGIDFMARKKLNTGIKGWTVVNSFGFGAPGHSNDFESEEMFLSITDGSTKLYLGTSHNYRFSRLFSIGFDTTYSHRTEARKPDSLGSQLRFLFQFNKFGLIPYIDHYTTFGGLDIGTTEFGNRGNDIGNNRLPFSEKDEEFIGVGLNSYYVISPKWIVDGFFQQKTEGENTDIGTNFGIGITHLL